MHRHQGFIDYVEGGNFNEVTIESYLLKYVLDQTQKDFLRDNDLTYSIIVNGQYECIGDLEQRVMNWMSSVNNSLGYRLFTV